MSKWFFINFLVLIYAIYQLISGYNGIHMTIGALGLLLVLYNWTRQAVFATIRSNISRKKKIKFAQLSKKALPFHKWTGTGAFIIIFFHAILVFNRYGFHAAYLKMTSGLIAGIVLTFVVLTGWLRWYRTTVRRRFIHWTLAFILFGTVVLHLIF